MRKKIIFTVWFMLCIISLFTKSVYAAKSAGVGFVLVNLDAGWGAGAGDTEARALEMLQAIGYDGEMKDEMRMEVTIKFATNSNLYNNMNVNSGGYNGAMDVGEGPWKVFINGSSGYENKNWKFKEAKDKFACEMDEPTRENVLKAIQEDSQGMDYTEAANNYVAPISYNAVIILKKDLSNLATSHDTTGNGNAGIRIYIDSIYTGSDMEEGRNIVLSDTNTPINAVTGTEEAGNILSEALAKLFIMLIEFVRGLYGDGPQMLLDSIQTTQYGTGISKFLPWKITYEKDEYTKDSYKNDYIKFSTDGSNVESSAKIVKEVSASENQFDEDTEIPVIPVDLYTLSVGQVSALDINFLTGQNNTELHSPDSVWTKLRNLAAGVIHITIYIGAGFLIATLIWHGICLVRSTLTPEDEKKHKDGIHDFAVAVAMLVGSIIIMAVCIFASNIVFKDMEVSSTKELPIRIVLTDSGSNIYSFSTNVTGYVRYLSETQSTSLITQKLKYTIVYIIFVWLNIMAVIIMLIRMVAIIILSILGPIIAVAYAMKKQGVFNITYKTWIIHYALWSSIQLIFAIACRIILEVSF